MEINTEEQLYDKSPTLINGWKELDGLENDKYRIEVSLEYGNGHVIPKFEVDDNDPSWYNHHCYLSTHTFYGSNYFSMTSLLRKLGFNIQLANWDGETRFCP